MENNYDALLEDWQKILGLTDWVIELDPECRPEEMDLEDCAGCTSWQESIKAARVQIIDEVFYPESIIPFDFEKILVHELLHVKTSLVSSQCGDLQERIMHQLIDDLARAFVHVKRLEIKEGE